MRVLSIAPPGAGKGAHGAALERRSDDTEEVIRRRLALHQRPPTRSRSVRDSRRHGQEESP
jgi:hypothetical protein